MFYVNDKREEVKASRPELSLGELAKEMGTMWKDLSDVDKKVSSPCMQDNIIPAIDSYFESFVLTNAVFDPDLLRQSSSGHGTLPKRVEQVIIVELYLHVINSVL